MSDDNTPDVTVEDDVNAAVAPEAPAPSRSRRGKGRGTTPGARVDPADDARTGEAVEPVPAAESETGADASVPEQEADGDDDLVRESSMSASAFEAITGELKDPELFDPEEVANAPRAPHPLKPVVEALIFASPEPLTLKAMGRLLDDQPREDIETALAEVRESYLRSDGLQLVEVAGGFQIVTRPELYEWVRRLFKERTTSKLSVQALETLAVIAYKQPVTSGEIAEIRGVSATTGVLNTLLDRKLVKIVGRKQVVGRPFMYGTTREFLDKFGLKDLSDLPKVEDMSEALGFDLPSPVGEGDGVSLPFGDAAPVEPLLFEDEELQATAPRGGSHVPVAPPASTEAPAEVSLDTDAPAASDAPDEER
ncbi:Segregation and condensation protein B [Luteitalea pratensis]|uniref:Segregation and condensation protein B n=1 Tax=Luteitalea pratensis TaxID=1855912 RepID=A0A143PT60_LUTPR|nr:SMC-Scp complex subunit ScpB [Luteitalea pratensis]AMY11270.1 Segregation and condensation protein B [Luteitalea pratensis]